MRAGATKNRLLRRGAAAALALAIAAAGTACGDGDSSSRTPDRAARPAFECPPRRDAARGAVVTLFHETHTHGNLAGTHDRDANVTFARYAGLVEALRSCLRDPDASLFLGNGDDVSRGIEGIRTDGRHTVDAFNAGGLDADTFGFSEILFGEHYDSYTEGLLLLRELVAESRFAWVSANVRDAADPTQVFASEQGARRWIVRRVGGVRVGITGLVSVKFSPGREQPLPSELATSIRVLEPARAMREVVLELRAAGAQVVVLLSHMSEVDTLRVVRSVEGIDVALGTHVGAPTPRPRMVNGTIVAVAGPDELQALGELELTVRRGRVVGHAFRRHVPRATDPVHRAVEAALERHLAHP